MQKINKPYTIGLDIGTSSVGWAVIGDDYRLMRHKRQNMWGSHLFDEAKKAEERRIFRTGRRRLDRRSRRIKLLRDIFSDNMNQLDAHFFLRLDEAMLLSEDKNEKLEMNANILFNDVNYNDKMYREKYPTIYHVRSDLFHTPDKMDLRLVYLAMHHIIKYRGNFLVEGSVNDVVTSSNNDILIPLFEILHIESGAVQDDIKGILLNTSISRSRRVDEVLGLLVDAAKEDLKRFKVILKAVLGMKWKAKDIFDTEYASEGEFSSANYEEKCEDIEAELGSDYELIGDLEAVYRWTVFSRYVKQGKCLSDVMVDRYNDYAVDLADIKSLVREFAPTSYSEFFHGKDTVKITFALYNNKHGKVNDITELYKAIRKLLPTSGLESDERMQRFNERTGWDGKSHQSTDFLSRQRIRDNGAIPRQIHQYELQQIIKNQSVHYPFLREAAGKIIAIHEFRLPYYVGPLNNDSEFSWAVIKEEGEILPWNFEEKVDVIASADEFIKRMRKNCTYLPGEDVLAQRSLLYSEFCVRNELKNVRLDGKRLDPSVQNDIYETLFKTKSSVSHADLRKKLIELQVTRNASPVITGTTNKSSFDNSLKAHVDFTQKVGLEVTPDTYEMIENIIHLITVFEDRKILERKIRLEYGAILSDVHIKAIMKLNYSGWGNLSRKFLDGISASTQYGELTIIEALRETRDNLMELLGDKYEYKRKIEDVVGKKNRTTISYADIKDLAGSPAIKRGIWRSIKIVHEIVDIMGYEPKRITIEMARQEDEKGVSSTSRKKQIEKMYADSIMSPADKKELLSELAEYQSQLNKKKFFLYFLQNGKCAYSGVDLDIDDGFRDSEIDHIIPRSLTKDDSLDNTVLVRRSENQRKLDEYPLSRTTVDKMQGIWRSWLKTGSASQTKIARLVRTTNLSEDDVSRFIARQLVETRQITKHVARMLSEQYADADTNIFTIRAGMPSEFRAWQDIPKCRDINDFHHAKDAYLAAVLSTYVTSRYPKLDRDFIYGQFIKHAGGTKRGRNDRSFIIASMAHDYVHEQTGEIAWEAKTLSNVIVPTMWYNDVLVTRKTLYGMGKFYNENLSKSNSGETMIDASFAMPSIKYGGYNNEEKASVIGIEFIEKNRSRLSKVCRLVNVPTYVAQEALTNADAIDSYIRGIYGDDAKVLTQQIPKRQKIIYNKYPRQEIYIVSADEVKNAKSVYYAKEMEQAISTTLKLGKVSDENRRYIDNFFDVYLLKLQLHYPLFQSEQLKLDGLRDDYTAMADDLKINLIRRLLRTTKPLDGLPGFASFADKKWKVGFNQKNGQKIDLRSVEFVYESITGLHRKVVPGGKFIISKAS